MEEIIKRIEELKMQIEDIQKVYKIELEREKNEKNDPIQANRKNKIDKLQAELKIAEINKEEKIKEIEKQIGGIQEIYANDLERGKSIENDPIQANRKNKIDKLQAELKIAGINKEEKMKEIEKQIGGINKEEKIKEIEKQIGGIQEIYANDLERGKSIENDPIQANRQHKIIKLQDEIEKIKTNESDKKEKNVIDNSIKNNFINLMNGKNVETDKVRGKVADSLFKNESFSKEEIEEANKIAKIKKEGIFKKSIKNIKNFTRKIKGFIKSKINHAKPIKLGKNKKDEEKNKMPEVELKSVEPKSIVSKNKENKRVNVEKAEINTADAIRRMEEAAEIKFAEEKENTK